MSHYADDKTFRTSDGSASTFEALAPSRPDRDFVFSIDSWDGPEQAIRISSDAASALCEWITAKRETTDA